MRDTPRFSPLIQRMLPLLVLLAAVLIAYILFKTRDQPQAQEAPLKRWNVTALSLQPVSAAPELELYGQIEAPQLTQLSSALNADVLTIEVREGDAVAAGELLLQLDPRESEFQLRQRQAEQAAIDARIAAEHNRQRNDLRSLQLEQEVQRLNEQRADRAERLRERNLLSQEQLDNTRLTTRQQALALQSRQQAIADHPHRLAQLTAEHQRAQALIDSAALELSRTRILAPFNGRIVSIDTAVGNRTRSGDLLLTLYDRDRLQLRAQIPESWLPTLRRALAGTALHAHALIDDHPLLLELDQLAARIGPGQAGIDALFRLQDTQVAALPGQTFNVRLQLPAQDGLFALPPTALYGSDRLYRLVEDDRLQSVEVQIAGQRQHEDGHQEVLVSSTVLQPGDRIITTQLPNAIGGLPVRVVE
ncbi:MAG: biotin/lipoyl-binding protein [Oceanospirillales bacterium]|nr:biotin/lipoyl-binding protein [Oceanospirillales bacterium]